jgi:signal transduction histidine kinase
VHDLVTQHHGRIWAEPATGGGTIFIAEFPSARPVV